MFEKVNPSHPDKMADRIAGALVDMAYAKQERPRIAVEVLLGHGECNIIAETSVHIDAQDVVSAVWRITGNGEFVRYREFPQDESLAQNQSERVRCGDNGVFRGCPVTDEQLFLSEIAHKYYDAIGTDGKYVIDGQRLVVCQSNMFVFEDPVDVDVSEASEKVVNPLGCPLWNTTDDDFVVEKGDRICQMVVMPYCPCEVVPVEELEGSERGTDGHGSTGVR